MLTLSNVSARYGSFQALFDVSLEVNAGESVAVIGPNGAGKTTLLRAISKLIDVSGGIAMNGRSLAGVPAHEVIAQGKPAEVAHDPKVIGVYLGTDAADVQKTVADRTT